MTEQETMREWAYDFLFRNIIYNYYPWRYIKSFWSLNLVNIILPTEFYSCYVSNEYFLMLIPQIWVLFTARDIICKFKPSFMNFNVVMFVVDVLTVNLQLVTYRFSLKLGHKNFFWRIIIFSSRVMDIWKVHLSKFN